MKKIAMFDHLYKLDREVSETRERYCEDHQYTTNAEFEWYGARSIIDVAGLYEEYFEYKMKRIRKEAKI